MDKNSPNALIIFVKHPRLGKVKTRLAADIGDEKALLVYRSLLHYTARVARATEADKFIFYDSSPLAEDEWDEDAAGKYIQTGEDLGEKMYNAFQTVFKLGYERCAIIGSDCPEVSAIIVNEAFECLKEFDFAMGPALDGGYYLLGMNSLCKEVFVNKRWSSPTVANDTLNDFKLLNKNFILLPVLSDLDYLADLKRFPGLMEDIS